MPAHLHESGDFAVKIVSVYADNPKLGLPTVAATVLALDPQTGMPLALMEGDSLTALRTGAAGGVAARYLARADAEPWPCSGPVSRPAPSFRRPWPCARLSGC
jgi:alanine dehydrogenase